MSLVENPPSPIVRNLQGLHLFHFDGAPCAQRVRFALGEKGLHRGREEPFNANTVASWQAEPGRWVSRRVSLVRREHMTPEYALIHPNLVVPALVHDGQLYLESLDIIEYLDAEFGGTPLIPRYPAERERTFALAEQAKALHVSLRYVTFHWGLGRLARLGDKELKQLKALAGQGSDQENLRSFYSGYSTQSIPDSVYEDHLRRLYHGFRELDAKLIAGQQWIAGDTLTLADPFWAMKVLRLIECGYPFAEMHPGVAGWFQRIRNRPAFQNEVMGHNRTGHLMFRIKAGLEKLLGLGLDRPLKKLAVAGR